MKTRIAILVTIVALLLAGGAVLAPSDERAPGVWFCAGKASAAAQEYHLTSVAWHVSGIASGGGYHLLEPATPKLTGSGCCCTYLPLILR